MTRHNSKLDELLQTRFSWNKSRIRFVSMFIISLIKVKTVNLTQIALSLNPHARAESNYRRSQRFLADFEFDFASIATFMLSLLPIANGFVLTLDRTNWKLGKKDINILMLAIAYKGIAFPILWSFLSKRGNSNTAERIKLMDRFIKLFGTSSIQCLVADREFIGKEWFDYLKVKQIAFYIRVRNNAQIIRGRGKIRVDSQFKMLKLNEYAILPQKEFIYGHQLSVVGMRLASEYLILVTLHEPESAIEYYKQRWQIETLFGAFKSRGFNFEDTHLTHPQRINKLVALLAITFAWAHLVGEWLHELKPLKVKKHQRLAKSIFRYGLDYLREILLNIHIKLAEFEKTIQILSCT